MRGVNATGREDLVRFKIAAFDAQAKTITFTRPISYFRSISEVRFGAADGDFYHAGSGLTVLAPTVSAHSPVGEVSRDSATDIKVDFDAAMDTAVAPRLLVQASGDCNPEIQPSGTRWDGTRTLRFRMQPHDRGTATIRIRANYAVAAGNGTLLDGNTNPRGQDRVGPAGDDYVWDLTCDLRVITIHVGVQANSRPPGFPPLPGTWCQWGDQCGFDYPVTTGSALIVEVHLNGRGGSVRCTFHWVFTVDGRNEHVWAADVGTPTFDFGPVQPGEHTISLRVTPQGCVLSPTDGSIVYFGTGDLKVTTNVGADRS